MQWTKVGLLLGWAVALAGCAEPVEGDWEQVPPGGCTNRGQLSVDGDLNLSGTVNMQDPVTQNCRMCSIVGTVEEAENDCYNGTLTLQDCPCDGEPSAPGDMCVQDDSEQLTFLIILQAACGDRQTVWEPI